MSIAVLFGSITVLNLRLLNLWGREIARAALVRMICPVAALGLGAAILTGGLLFATRAPHYAGLDLFLLKMGLLLAGTSAALIAHFRYGWDLRHAPDGQARFHGIFSQAVWFGVLICGRLIAFA